MEGRILAAAGKAAGLAGISIGAFLIIFRDVLATNFLPKSGLSQVQAFSVLIFLMIVTFGIAGVGVTAWLIGRTSKKVRTSELIIISLLLLSILITAVLFSNKQTQNAEDAIRSAEMHEKILKNAAKLSPLTNSQVANLTSKCSWRSDYFYDTFAPQYIESWRDRTKYQPEFDYSTLERDLNGLIPQGKIDAEEKTKWIDAINCLEDEIRDLVGPDT
ncbi:hypothetical protein [Kaistia soli]|uniref:hypothetical protein n=1 Tax=Kaistia soli TaxID=446684 RepID=UPI00111472DC|nr:hypothetical protein [Kaistia soli]